MRYHNWRDFFMKRPRRSCSVTKHYVTHKEAARSVINDRLLYWNQWYGYSWQRVAIRNQRRCWGSCSSKKNLNFSYKLQFLPPCLHDYVVVHELCHLEELNHGEQFWALVEKTIPDYVARRARLRALEQTHGTSIESLTKYSQRYCCGMCTR